MLLVNGTIITGIICVIKISFFQCKMKTELCNPASNE